MKMLALLGAGVLALGGNQAITLKRTPKVGESAKYQVKLSATIQGQDLEISYLQTVKVTKAGPDGFTQEVSQSGMTLNGEEAPSAPATVRESDRKLTGELVKMMGPNISTATYRMSNLNSFIFPDKPVAPGDSWSWDRKDDAATGMVAAHIEFKYIGNEKVGAVDAAKVTAVAKELSGPTPASLELTFWIDPRDGSAIRLKGSGKSLPFGGPAGSADATVEQTRVP